MTVQACRYLERLTFPLYCVFSAIKRGHNNLLFRCNMSNVKEDSRLFVGSDYSADYARFRLCTPPAVIETVLAFLGEKLKPPYQYAIDVGCGTGQGTRILAPFFQQVLGCDCSETQVNQASEMENPPNVSYRVSTAETLPLPDSGVQLVIAQKSAHWFNIEAFFTEVQRILVPGGVVALSSHVHLYLSDNRCQKQLDDILNKLYHVTLQPLWPKEIDIQEAYYKDIRIPYSEQQKKKGIIVHHPATLSRFLGHLNTMCAFQILRRDNEAKADNVLLDIQTEMLQALGSTSSAEDTPVTIKAEYFVLLGRKPIK